MEPVKGSTENPLSFLSPELLAEMRRIELRTRKKINSDLMGGYRSAFRGSGLVFSDLREYLPGDEVRNIHWKATARSQRAYVKTFEEDRHLLVHLLVDISRSTLSGAPVSRRRTALEFSALVSLLAHRSQDSIGLSLFSDHLEATLRPRQHRSQLQRILMTLLEHREFRPSTDLAASLKEFMGVQRRSAVVFIVSDFYSPPFEEQLRQLSLRHDVVLVALERDQAETIPRVGLVQFRDAESGELMTIDTSSRFCRKILEQQYEKRIQEIERLARTANADFIVLGSNPIRPLSRLMQRRMGRLR